jgi:hypothetical protein
MALPLGNGRGVESQDQERTIGVFVRSGNRGMEEVWSRSRSDRWISERAGWAHYLHKEDEVNFRFSTQKHFPCARGTQETKWKQVELDAGTDFKHE